MLSKDLILKGFLCIMTLAMFASCARTSQTSQREDTLARVHRTRQIDACVVVIPPNVIKNAKTGELSGEDIDAMNLIAGKINAKVVYHETSAPNMMADLQSGRCDVISEASLFATIPRAFNVAFTEPPPYYIGLSAIIKKNDKRFKDAKDVFEFDKPGVTVVVNTGEVGETWVKENFKKALVKHIDTESGDATRFVVEVSAGRADVSIADANTLSLYAKQHPEVLDLFKDHPFSVTPGGWAVRTDDVQWYHFLENSLQYIETQGLWTQLEKKYNAHWIHLVKEYKLQ